VVTYGAGVRLLLLDLDNTLLDREQAFLAWAGHFLADLDAPAADLDWLQEVDGDGFVPRHEVAAAIRDRYGLRASVEAIVDRLHTGVVRHTRLDPLVACALTIARQAGWVPVVVSNGVTFQQEAKIRMTGLDRYLADWVISEDVGVRKPDPAIFEVAAGRARLRLDSAWVVGDSPRADIYGASVLGLPSVWLHRGRRWTERDFGPTRTADGPLAALAAVMDARSIRR
jgi:putative hydrolase of the HAD superfamily